MKKKIAFTLITRSYECEHMLVAIEQATPIKNVLGNIQGLEWDIQ